MGSLRQSSSEVTSTKLSRYRHQLNMFQQRRSRKNHKEVCEKYQLQYASTPRMMKKSFDLPPRPPPLERPPLFRPPSPAPPASHADSWRMSLTQYRKPARFSEQVPSYEKSMLEVSRRIRNKSVPPPAPSSVSPATLRALSRPPTPTPTPGGPGRYCSCNSNNKRTYASNITYTQMFDFKRNTPSRGY